MRGVQFLTDYQGRKTGVLVDLKEHSEFWADVVEECGEPIDFQFLIDDQGEKIAVLLEFEKHSELWEDIYDSLIIESRKDEQRVPWEEVKHGLIEKGKLSV